MSMTVLATSVVRGAFDPDRPPMLQLHYHTPPSSPSREGVSGKTGKPYRVDVYGWESQKIDISNEAFPEVAAMKLPGKYVIQFSPDPRNPRRNLCTGLAPVKDDAGK